METDTRSGTPGEEMTIGELAARFGLATHVLRHWEAVGLLGPERRGRTVGAATVGSISTVWRSSCAARRPASAWDSCAISSPHQIPPPEGRWSSVIVRRSSGGSPRLPRL